ncbi:MAG: DNA repair protein RadC [Oscillospiraceae bacterium]|nr:DNA repair protein RadC [Oscillospiraceae bacterium]
MENDTTILKEQPANNLHKGHRFRVKQRFLTHGLDDFDDHQVLELLLFYAIPQRDVNPLAHTLLNHFGTLSAVLDAPVEELQKFPGIGKNAITLLKLIPQVSRRYMVSRTSLDTILDTVEKAGAYLLPRFYAQRNEVVYLVCMDAKRKVLNCQLLFQGTVNSAHISIRKIVETALVYNSTSVIIAHNHTSGIALPSSEDFQVTLKIRDALEMVGVELADHLVVADDDFVSMLETGMLSH